MVKWFGKKGLESEAVIFLIVALAIAIPAYILIGNIGESTDRSALDTACWSSVQKNARLHINGLEFPSTLKCPANNIEITDTSAGAQNQDKKKIADAMYNCWYNYGEGKLDLFTDEGVYCTVCSFIDVKSSEPIVGLPEYLFTETIPDKSGRYYSSYLASYSTENAMKEVDAAFNTPPNPEDLVHNPDTFTSMAKNRDLPGEKKYAVIFIYAKGYDTLQRVMNTLTVATPDSKLGLAMGGFFGGSAGGTIGGTVAGGWALIGALGLVTGPPGWLTIAAVGAGITIGALTGWAASYFTSDKVAEWAAFTALREWNSADTQNFLNHYGCNYFPTDLE